MKNFIVPVLNRYLDCDPEVSQELASISGKTICINVKELELILTMKVEQNFLQESEDDIEADVVINLSLRALPGFLMGVDTNKIIKDGDIEISGDTHVASVFQNTLRQIEIDWEEILAKYTGDAVAYQAGLAAKSLKEFVGDVRKNLRLDTRDYLQDNIQVVPTKNEISDFIQDVDTLRADVDRLEARINRLH